MSRSKGDREISLHQLAQIIIYSAENKFSRPEIAKISNVSSDTVWRYQKKGILI